MWTLDDNNMENLLIWLSLFVVFPLFCYGFYMFTEVSIFIWLMISAAAACIMMFVLSPFIMIFCFLIEAVFKLIASIVNFMAREPSKTRQEQAKSQEIVARHKMYYDTYEKLRSE